MGCKINEMNHRILQKTNALTPPFKYDFLFSHEERKYYSFPCVIADAIKGAYSDITEIPFIDAGGRKLTES